MNKLIATALLTSALAANAAPTMLLGNLVSVNGTSNSAVVNMPNQTVSFQPFSFQNGGLTSTNDVTLHVQLSTDGTNYNTVNSYKFTTTNAASVNYFAPSTNITVYMRVQAVTTNATLLGGSYGN